jgi:gliding motility-associated-like protein
VGGTVDPASQTVRIKSSFLGNYQLRIAALATSLTLNQANVYPRVFTPNGDGYNDRVYFVLENPNGATVTGEIFDLGGRAVATLMSQAGTGIGTTLIWDGKDSSGAVVPGGAYMYKIKGEGKTFTGTVGVAR